MTKYPSRFGTPLPMGHKPAQSKMFGRNNDLRWSLRLAEIIRVDYENMVCDLVYLQGDSPAIEEVPISSAYWSKRGFLGAMPEKGAICVVGQSAAHLDQATRPLILSFLPNGFKTALRFEPFGAIPRDKDGLVLDDDVEQVEMEGKFGPIRHKMRKIYPGNIYAMSAQGSEIILDTGIKMFDRFGNEFHLRDSDNSAILTTSDFYVTTSAGRFTSGKVIRNGLNVPTDFLGENGSLDENHPLFDVLLNKGIIYDDGSLAPDINSLNYIVLSDGRKVSPITKGQEDPNFYHAEFYNENRIEIQEFSTAIPNLNNAFGADIDMLEDQYRPFIEHVMGTVIGNDPYTLGGRDSYGKVLKPVLFSTPEDKKGFARLEPITDDEGEESSLGGAFLYRMQRPDGLGELFLSHDKEGHVYLSIPASTSKAGNLGAGRSLGAKFDGSVKMVVGANKQDGSSLDMTAEGGVKWSLGTLARSKRSLEVKARGGVNIRIEKPDVNGDAFRITSKGNISIATEGTFSVSSTGDNLERVRGKREITADSLAFNAGISNFTINVASDKDITVKGSYISKIGEGKETTILTGGEKKTIYSGDDVKTFHAPAITKTSFLSTGKDIIESNTTLTMERKASAQASYLFDAPSGEYTVSLSTGSIKLSAGAGVVNVSNSSVSIKAPQISLEGQVGLGDGLTAMHAVIGGVSGPSPHLDYITGAPLRGNSKVKTV